MISIYYNYKIQLQDIEAKKLAQRLGWTETVENPAFVKDAPPDSPQAKNPEFVSNRVGYEEIVQAHFKTVLDSACEAEQAKWQ